MQTVTAWPMQRMTSRTMQDKPRTATVTVMGQHRPQAVTPSPTTPRSGPTVTVTATVTRPRHKWNASDDGHQWEDADGDGVGDNKTTQMAMLSQRTHPVVRP